MGSVQRRCRSVGRLRRRRLDITARAARGDTSSRCDGTVVDGCGWGHSSCDRTQASLREVDLHADQRPGALSAVQADYTDERLYARSATAYAARRALGACRRYCAGFRGPPPGLGRYCAELEIVLGALPPYSAESRSRPPSTPRLLERVAGRARSPASNSIELTSFQ